MSCVTAADLLDFPTRRSAFWEGLAIGIDRDPTRTVAFGGGQGNRAKMPSLKMQDLQIVDRIKAALVALILIIWYDYVSLAATKMPAVMLYSSSRFKVATVPNARSGYHNARQSRNMNVDKCRLDLEVHSESIPCLA